MPSLYPRGDYKKYNNFDYNFSIFLPEKWERSERQIKDGYLISLTDNDSAINLLISAHSKWKQDTWINQGVAGTIENPKKILETPIAEIKDRISGKLVVYEYIQNKKKYIQRNYITWFYNTLLLIQYIGIKLQSNTFR